MDVIKYINNPNPQTAIDEGYKRLAKAILSGPVTTEDVDIGDEDVKMFCIQGKEMIFVEERVEQPVLSGEVMFVPAFRLPKTQEEAEELVAAAAAVAAMA